MLRSLSLILGSLLATCSYATEAELTVRAMLEPVNEAKISSELNGRIHKVTVRDGDAYKKGDLLIQYDCQPYQSELKAVQAELGAARVQLTNKQQLRAMKSVGQMEVDLAQFDVTKLEARVQSALYQVEHCRVLAPFSGHVVEVQTNSFEHVTVGSELIWLQDDNTLQVSLIVPSHWLQWLASGQTFRFRVDETGVEYQGEIIRLGARVDAVSQTIRVIGQLQSSDETLVPGMSGSALFDKDATSGH